MFNPADFDPTKLDPSKMDPKTLMKLSEIVQQLPPEKLSKMQTLMHNMMAGFDVRKEMEEFEKTLPPGFRENLMAAFMGGGGFGPAPQKQDEIEIQAEPISQSSKGATQTGITDETRDARLIVLRGVAEGEITPEEAEQILFFVDELAESDLKN